MANVQYIIFIYINSNYAHEYRILSAESKKRKEEMIEMMDDQASKHTEHQR